MHNYSPGLVKIAKEWEVWDLTLKRVRFGGSGVRVWDLAQKLESHTKTVRVERSGQEAWVRFSIWMQKCVAVFDLWPLKLCMLCSPFQCQTLIFWLVFPRDNRTLLALLTKLKPWATPGIRTIPKNGRHWQCCPVWNLKTGRCAWGPSIIYYGTRPLNLKSTK